MLGRHLTEEQKRKVSEFAKTRTGDKNGAFLEKHILKTTKR